MVLARLSLRRGEGEEVGERDRVAEEPRGRSRGEDTVVDYFFGFVQGRRSKEYCRSC